MHQHVYEPDDQGVGCARCPLPARNRVHVAASAPIAPARPVVHADQAPTSIDAAMLANWQRLTTVKATVYRAVEAAGPAGITDDELMATEHLRNANPNTVRPRRVDLAREGVIEVARDEHGQEVTRTTRGGSPAQVWVLTAQARALSQGAVA